MDPYLFQRLWRRPWLSVCSLILSAVLCFLMGFLTDYRADQQQRLEDTKTQYDILCVVTDRRGTRTNTLKMNEETLNFVLDESPEGFRQYTRDLRISKEFEYTCPVLGLTNVLDLTVYGVNNERCADVLNPEMDASVTYLVDNFYDQDEYLCLVSEEIYNQMVELERDTLKLFVEDPFISERIREWVGTGVIEATVAGYYSGTGNAIYLSFPAAMRLCDEITGQRSCDAISFYAADNERLEEISGAAKAYFGSVNPNAPDNAIPHVGLTIHDEQYRATIAALEQNIARTGYLLPIVTALGLGVGFLISFLYTRNERRTYALMRTMGMTRGRLFGSILREQLVLVSVAVLIAFALTREGGSTAVYFVSYTIGCCMCIIRAIRVPPTAILRDQE